MWPLNRKKNVKDVISTTTLPSLSSNVLIVGKFEKPFNCSSFLYLFII